MLMLVLAALPSPGSSAVAGSTIETPVAFSVVNVNTSRTAGACTPDGKPYTVRGVLAGPAEAFEDAPTDAVTLYIHGSGDGSTWNFTGFPGVNHIAEMAGLGHVSVFMHMLGYGTSDPVDGNAICLGSYADIAHQVVQHLRAGTYDASGHPTPAFERVALASHSGFSLAAELYAISWSDIDALVMTGWADVAPSFVPLYKNAVSLGVACADGGDSKAAGGPPGWHRFFSDEDLDTLMYNTEPEVVHAFLERYEFDFCGLVKDAVAILAADLALSPLIVEIPVLLVYGDHDPFLPGAFELKRARFLASDEVSLSVLPNTGHSMMLGRTAAEFRAVLSAWLAARGF